MKTFLQYMGEATEAQARASAGPNTSPELIRRAAERSQRSAAQRNAPKPKGPIKGQKALPAGGVLAKRDSSALDRKRDSRGQQVDTSRTTRQPVGKSTADKAARKKNTGGYMSSPDKASSDPRKRGLNKMAAQKKEKDRDTGFMSGVKKELGGDNFHKNDEKRKQARKETGQNLVRGAKSFAKGALSSRGSSGNVASGGDTSAPATRLS